MKRASLVLPVLAVALLGACATPIAPGPGPEVSVRPSEARGRLKPMALKPLDLHADCRFTDEAGYGASARIEVKQSEVRAFAASIEVPRRGNCRFELADFEQVKTPAHVELRARDGCVVRMWEQGDQVTVAFAQCASRCDRGTFDYVWPILVDRPSGRCS